jgi:hypothetical protein
LDDENAHNVLPLTFFSYNRNKTVTLRLPTELTHEILEPKVAEWLSFYLKEKKLWMNESMTASGIASTI